MSAVVVVGDGRRCRRRRIIQLITVVHS